VLCPFNRVAGNGHPASPLPASCQLFNDTRGEEDDGLHQLQDSAYRNPQQPKGEKQEPDQRVQDEGHKSQRPTEDQKNAPEQEFDHTISLILPMMDFLKFDS
jgi:hypothetical protein